MRLVTLAILATTAACAFESSDSLARVFELTGFSKNSGKVLYWHDIQGIEQNYQTPPPFVTIPETRECWTDLSSGVQRVTSSLTFFGSAPTPPATTLLSRQSVFAVRDGKVTPAPGATAQRNLDLWSVLTDWRDASDVRRAADQDYLGFARIVLVRKGQFGEERLFIDPQSGFPLKLDRTEPHYLWGQVHVEFIWSIWQQHGTALVPTAAARVVDGFKEITRTVGNFEIIDRAQAPDLTVPAGAEPGNPTPLFLQPVPPKKIDVGPNVFLSSNPGYTEAFALINGTIYVLDATQSGVRAQQDLDLVRAAFPGQHPIVLVVSDLAWPHIAGVRFWVAQGAKIVSHRTSKDFLERVVGRRWTLNPDLLEQRRKSAKFNFVPVDNELTLAAGKVRIIAIPGTENEGAVMAFLTDERFLWACDCIQDVTRPAINTNEVMQAARHSGVSPRQVAAMHIPLTDWEKIEALMNGG